MVEILSFNTFVCNNYFYVYLVLRQNLLTSLTTHLFSQQPTYSMRGDKMINKEQVKKLRDNAELAMASYGYFNLIGKRFEKKILKDIGRESTSIITQTDILDLTYNKYIAVESNPHKPDDEIKVGKLKGDFTPNQAKRFFSRYDLLIHQPNTESGFSATLFGEKRKQRNTESKEIGYTSEYGYINWIKKRELINRFKDMAEFTDAL